MKKIYGAIALSLASAIALSWLTGIAPEIRSFGEGQFVTMKLYTALMFCVSIPAFFARDKIRDILMFLLAAIICLSVVSAAISDSGAFSADDDGLHSVAPGIPSIATIVCFVVVWGRLLLGESSIAIRIGCASWFALNGLVALSGYILDMPALYGKLEFSGAMAIPTAVFFLLMGIQGLTNAASDYSERRKQDK